MKFGSGVDCNIVNTEFVFTCVQLIHSVHLATVIWAMDLATGNSCLSRYCYVLFNL